MAYENPPWLVDPKTAVMSPTGLEMLKHFEGFRQNAYQDSAGNWTIGYGHRLIGPNPDWISSAKADALLDQDLRIAYEPIRNTITVEITQGIFDGLTDFVFNLGGRTYTRSRIAAYINTGRVDLAAAEIRAYNMAGGKVLPGLVARRDWESQAILAP